MRICFISWEYPLTTNFGGIAFYVQAIAQKMALSGCFVSVITANLNGETSRVQDEFGVDVYQIGAKNHQDYTIKIETVLEMLVQENNNIPFDIIESAEFFGDTRHIKEIHKYAQLKITRLHGCSIRYYFFNNSNFSMLFYPLLTKLNLIYLKRFRRYIKTNFTSALLTDYYEKREANVADIVTAPSQQLFDFVSRFWKVKEILIYPNPSTRLYSSNTFKKEFNKNECVISFIGTLSIQKGFDLFIDFIEELSENCDFLKGPNFKINICGSYNENLEIIESWLVRLEKVNLNQKFEIINHGWLHKRDVDKVLIETNFLFLLSRFDNFPNVHIEAMTFGCVVICGVGTGTHYLTNLVNPKLCFRNYNKLVILNLFLDLLKLDSKQLVGLSNLSKEVVKKEILDFDHVGIYKSLLSDK